MRRKVTQVEIAKRLGLDVSTVNKILNTVAGPKFKKATIARVLATAKRMGYESGKATRTALLGELRDLFPPDSAEDDLAKLRGVSLERVQQIKQLVWPTELAGGNS